MRVYLWICDKIVKGNPYLTEGLMKRRMELLRRLLEADKTDWKRIKAKFAVEYGLREVTVDGYFVLLKTAGMLD